MRTYTVVCDNCKKSLSNQKIITVIHEHVNVLTLAIYTPENTSNEVVNNKNIIELCSTACLREYLNKFLAKNKMSSIETLSQG